MLPRLEPAHSAFDVLALVTSGGGSGALATVMAELPDALPATLLLGHHLGTDQALEELLSCHPRWPVRWVQNGTQLEAGHLYIGLPRTLLEVQPDHRFSATFLQDEGRAGRALDGLLTSLADSCGSRVLAVVLAGEGADGATGARAIVDAGGTVLVQQPETAVHADLPNAVIKAGADLVFPLHDLSRLVTELLTGTASSQCVISNAQVRTGQPARPQDVQGIPVELNRTMFKGIDASNARPGESTREVASVFSDVSERKRIERALRESEERFRLFVTASSDIVYRMSADWSQMHSLVGKGFLSDTSDPSPTWIEKYIPASEKAFVQAAIREAIRTKAAFELEHRVLRENGTLGWTLSRAIPLLDEHGEIVEWFGAATDVTGRKEAEEALQASEERFRAVANLVPDLLWESEPNGDTIWHNTRWLEYTGQTLEQANSWGWVDAIHPEDWESSARRYRAAVTAGQPLRQEHRIRRHDGHYRWFAVDTVPLKDDHEQVIRIYGSATDIHDLRTVNSVLEVQVEDRTQRLTDLNSELRTLATVSSEELNEPLRRLRGFLHLLERRIADHLDEKTQHYFDLIQVEAVRAERLAQDFKALAYLEHRDIKPALVPLVTLVLQVRSDLAPRLIGRTVAWSVGTLPVVKGDAMLLRQAFTELLHHSLKLIPEGNKAQVEVNATPVDGREVILVEVAPVRADLAGLHGDGLATARRVIQRHGGTLETELQGEHLRIRLHLPDRRD